jgi:hypothetical protein
MKLRKEGVSERIATLKEGIASAHDCLQTLPVTPEERADLERYIRSLEQAIADAERVADAEKATG